MYSKFEEMASLCRDVQRILDELHNLREHRFKRIAVIQAEIAVTQAEILDDLNNNLEFSLKNHQWFVRHCERQIVKIRQLYSNIWVHDDTTFQSEIIRINLEDPKVKELQTIIKEYS